MRAMSECVTYVLYSASEAESFMERRDRRQMKECVQSLLMGPLAHHLKRGRNSGESGEESEGRRHAHRRVGAAGADATTWVWGARSMAPSMIIVTCGHHNISGYNNVDTNISNNSNDH
jgi:hypothetical protein